MNWRVVFLLAVALFAVVHFSYNGRNQVAVVSSKPLGLGLLVSHQGPLWPVDADSLLAGDAASLKALLDQRQDVSSVVVWPRDSSRQSIRRGERLTLISRWNDSTWAIGTVVDEHSAPVELWTRGLQALINQQQTVATITVQ